MWAALLLLIYAVALSSLLLNILRTRQLVGGRPARSPPVADGRESPPLDVLIPVKDEAANIAACVESALSQDYPALRVIVIDDRSTDGTGEVLRGLQQRWPQLSVLTVTQLAPGCYGKPHALHSARAELRGELVAFVDSDLVLRPDCLRTLARDLGAERLDWLAVMGAPQIGGFWERVIVPVFGAVVFAWYDPRKISDPAWPDAIGSALMVARRSAYESIGGHEAVIEIYDEDSELIRKAKRAGQRVSFVMAPELFSQRHYGTLRRTVQGITRTFVGGIKTMPRLSYTIVALAFTSLLPWAIFALLAVTRAAGCNIPHESAWAAMAAAHLALSGWLASMVYRTADAPLRYATLHPLAAVVLIGVCLRAAVHLHRARPVTWRGTTYQESVL